MELVALASVDATALRWLRTADSPAAFELASGDRPVGRLAWQRPSGTLATFATADSAVSLKRVGFLHPIVTARRASDPRDLARVSVHLNYHRIEIAGGPSFRLHRAGLMVPAWKVSTEGGTELLHIEPIREGRKLVGGAVIASPDGARRGEIGLLAGLAWYMIVLAWFEDEALVPFEGPDAPTSSPAPAR
jgi:hypothetical protein